MIMAMTPAKAGAAAEVPPTPWKSVKWLLVRSQELPAVGFASCWQMM